MTVAIHNSANFMEHVQWWHSSTRQPSCLHGCVSNEGPVKPLSLCPEKRSEHVSCHQCLAHPLIVKHIDIRSKHDRCKPKLLTEPLKHLKTNNKKNSNSMPQTFGVRYSSRMLLRSRLRFKARWSQRSTRPVAHRSQDGHQQSL